jgi:hypothetical protein
VGTSLGRKKNGEGGVSVEYGTVKALHAVAERIGLMDIINWPVPIEGIGSELDSSQSFDRPSTRLIGRLVTGEFVP